MSIIKFIYVKYMDQIALKYFPTNTESSIFIYRILDANQWRVLIVL